MDEKHNKNMSVRLTDEARAKIDRTVAALREKPPVAGFGRATIGSVVSAAIIEGIDVLMAKYGIDNAETD